MTPEGSTLRIRAERGPLSTMRSRFLPIVLLALGLLTILIAISTSAQVPLLPDEVERLDVIAIERDQQEFYSFDALTGRRANFRLEVGEKVLFQRAHGRVGVVLTDRRVLGVAPGTPWLEMRLGTQEEPADRGLVEDRIALLVTNRRALAFTGAGGWVEEAFSPSETALALRAGSAAGVVTTNRRALGIAPALGRFVTEDLRVREVLESVNTQDTLVTLRTNKRILVFSAPRAIWTQQKLQIN